MQNWRTLEQMFQHAAIQQKTDPTKSAWGVTDTPTTAGSHKPRRERKQSTLHYRLKRMEGLQIADAPVAAAADNVPTSPVAKRRPRATCLKHVQRHEMVILVYAKCAKNLVNCDEFTRSDPYLDLQVMHNGNSHKKMEMAHRCTHHLNDTLSPQWNEMFAIDATDYDLEGCAFTLNCTVLDHDVGDADDVLGKVELDLTHPHVANAAELGSNMSWVAHNAHAYKLKDLPGFAPQESELTLSIVKATKHDFVWWCDRVGIDPDETICHGVSKGLERALHRKINKAHEVANNKEKREALAYLEGVGGKQFRPKRHSVALLIENEQSRKDDSFGSIHSRYDKTARDEVSASQQTQHGSRRRRTSSSHHRKSPSSSCSFSPVSQNSILRTHVVCKASSTGWVRRSGTNQGQGESAHPPDLLDVLHRIRSSARVLHR
jgi:hypothetical protein